MNRINLMKHPHILLLAVSLAATSSVYAQTVVYTETFPHSGSGNQPVNTVAWQTYNTSSATNLSGNSAFANGFIISSQNGIDGNPGDLSTTFQGIGLTFTDEFTSINRSVTEIATLSFATNNANTTDTYRFAIRVDVEGTPTWYATNATYSQITGGASTNFPTNGETKTFTFTTDASAWRELTFSAGSTLSLSGTTLTDPLPMGNLTAAGIYNDLNTAALRWDNFQIAVIPEPTTYALVVGALALLVCLRRRY